MATAEDAELDTFANRDRERRDPSTHDRNGVRVHPRGSQPQPKPAEPPPWLRGKQLVDAILERANDPWIGISVGADELLRARVGATVVLLGGSGSGKTSLVLEMLMQHATDVGPAILLSIELPVEEAASRIVGARCDTSWGDSLRGKVPVADMLRVLDLPRLFVLDRRRATIPNLDACIATAREEFPGQPILVAIDYMQILAIDTKEREIRMRVTDAFMQIDDIARERRVVAIALSQMSTANEGKARRGEATGLDSSELGAEATAAIKRFATVTLALGLSVPSEDGTEVVELNIGKWRMGKGDRVVPMRYDGRIGRWRVGGEASSAEEVRNKRDVEATAKLLQAVRLKVIGAATSSPGPVSRNQLVDLVAGDRVGRARVGRATALREIGALITEGLDAWKNGARAELVEIAKRAPGSRKARPAWLLWTEDRARAIGLPLAREVSLFSESS